MPPLFAERACLLLRHEFGVGAVCEKRSRIHWLVVDWNFVVVVVDLENSRN